MAAVNPELITVAARVERALNEVLASFPKDPYATLATLLQHAAREHAAAASGPPMRVSVRADARSDALVVEVRILSRGCETLVLRKKVGPEAFLPPEQEEQEEAAEPAMTPLALAQQAADAVSATELGDWPRSTAALAPVAALGADPQRLTAQVMKVLLLAHCNANADTVYGSLRDYLHPPADLEAPPGSRQHSSRASHRSSTPLGLPRKCHQLQKQNRAGPPTAVPSWPPQHWPRVVFPVKQVGQMEVGLGFALDVLRDLDEAQDGADPVPASTLETLLRVALQVQEEAGGDSLEDAVLGVRQAAAQALLADPAFAGALARAASRGGARSDEDREMLALQQCFGVLSCRGDDVFADGQYDGQPAEDHLDDIRAAIKAADGWCTLCALPLHCHDPLLPDLDLGGCVVLRLPADLQPPAPPPDPDAEPAEAEAASPAEPLSVPGIERVQIEQVVEVGSVDGNFGPSTVASAEPALRLLALPPVGSALSQRLLWCDPSVEECPELFDVALAYGPSVHLWIQGDGEAWQNLTQGWAGRLRLQLARGAARAAQQALSLEVFAEGLSALGLPHRSDQEPAQRWGSVFRALASGRDALQPQDFEEIRTFEPAQLAELEALREQLFEALGEQLQGRSLVRAVYTLCLPVDGDPAKGLSELEFGAGLSALGFTPGKGRSSIKGIFAALDCDHSGQLPLSQLQTLFIVGTRARLDAIENVKAFLLGILEQEKVKRPKMDLAELLLHILDRNRSSQVSLHEFLTTCFRRGYPEEQWEDVEAVFQVLDVNLNGHLCVDELAGVEDLSADELREQLAQVARFFNTKGLEQSFMALIASLGRMTRDQKGQQDLSSMSLARKEWIVGAKRLVADGAVGSEYAKDVDWRVVFSLLDVNASGKLAWDEFRLLGDFRQLEEVVARGKELAELTDEVRQFVLSRFSSLEDAFRQIGDAGREVVG